jgi:hypothetical protein
MADTQNGAAPAAPTPDSAKSYRLTLARSVEIAPKVWARPGSHETIVKGSLIAGLGDAVTKYEEV